MSFTRRAAIIGGFGVGASAFALAWAYRRRPRRPLPGPRGPLIPDPERILDLPKGFSYRILERTGDQMDDGNFVPSALDGMACFEDEDGRWVLMRNSEQTPDSPHSPYPRDLELPRDAPAEAYDPICLGGVSRVVVDPATLERVSSNLVLAGTQRNCAGGPSPWGWLSCEETTDTPALYPALKRRHGYVFPCPVDAERLTAIEPIRAYGRFRHEAVAVLEDSHIAYLTEDTDDACMYRFVPDDPARPFEGKLQALQLEGLSRADDWSLRAGGPSEERTARWIDLEEIEDDVALAAQALGATVFTRGEGIWAGSRGELFFCCTSGGVHGEGQIFRLRHGAGDEGNDRMSLIVEADGEDLTNPDNITVAPWGELFVCEDDYSPRHDHIRAVSPEGTLSDFALNRYTDGEMAGVCFSPDGRVMFVNIFDPGMTLAITGPFPVAGV